MWCFYSNNVLAKPKMSANVTVTSARACCENGRPIMTDPHTGQTICSCQYGTALLNYTRIQGLPDGIYGASAAAYAAGAAQGYVPLGSEGSAFYSPLTNPAAFDMKEGSEAWRALAAQSGCFPYDPNMALYSYGTGYGGLDLNARRKNATRETTNTLKAWLFEHRKNPYPTKGEKIMLAIITKMTLTQVSTWFANARRRLKKENKMTWSPRNRSEDDASGDEDIDVDSKTNGNDSDGTQVTASLEENCETRRINPDRETFDRIISVDEDEEDDDDNQSDQSDIGDTEINESVIDRKYNSVGDRNTASMRLHDAVTGGDNATKSVSEDSTRENETKSLKMTNNSKNARDSNAKPQMARPKIWSVLDVLANKDTSNFKTSPQSSQNTAAVVCSRQTHGPAFLNAHQANQNFRSTQFPMGFNGYPFSFSHTTLSYPYTLSAATGAKSEMSTKHATALNVGEQSFKEGLVEKVARMQGGIFSPARELDGLRVGGKIVL